MNAVQKRSLNAAMKTQELAIFQLQRTMLKGEKVSITDPRDQALTYMRKARRLLETAALESFITESNLVR